MDRRMRRCRVAVIAALVIGFVFLMWTWTQQQCNSAVSRDPPIKATPTVFYSFALKNAGEEKYLNENPPTGNAEKIAVYLRKYHLTPPSRGRYWLNSKMKKYPSAIGRQLKKLFQNQTNGFFVEAGANDGQILSNTLRLEMKQNWTGLLVQPDPFIVPALRLTNRRAWIADVCLSTVGHPVKIRFLHKVGVTDALQAFNSQGITASDSREGVRDARNYVDAGAVDCFPLEALLIALNRTVVDYVSMDIDGMEYKVLQNFPFHKIIVKVLSIKYDLIPEGFDRLKTMLNSNNFKIVFKTKQDLIAINWKFTQLYNLPG